MYGSWKINFDFQTSLLNRSTSRHQSTRPCRTGKSVIFAGDRNRRTEPFYGVKHQYRRLSIVIINTSKFERQNQINILSVLQFSHTNEKEKKSRGFINNYRSKIFGHKRQHFNRWGIEFDANSSSMFVGAWKC